jgi:hypothetical protein
MAAPPPMNKLSAARRKKAKTRMKGYLLAQIQESMK